MKGAIFALFLAVEKLFFLCNKTTNLHIHILYYIVKICNKTTNIHIHILESICIFSIRTSDSDKQWSSLAVWEIRVCERAQGHSSLIIDSREPKN